MISVNDFKTGLTLQLDNGLWSVVEFLHVKPGKGAAFVRSKLKNVETGQVVEKTFRAGEKVAKATLDRREMQYLYKEGKDAAYVINANYAVQAGLNPSKDAIALEKKSSPYANIIAVRKADKNKPAIKKLVKALESKDTQNWIKKEFKGGVLPAK